MNLSWIWQCYVFIYVSSFQTFCVMLCSFSFCRSIFWSLFWPAWTRGHSDAPMRACRGHEFQRWQPQLLRGINEQRLDGGAAIVYVWKICRTIQERRYGLTAAEPAQNGRGTSTSWLFVSSGPSPPSEAVPATLIEEYLRKPKNLRFSVIIKSSSKWQ